MSWLRVLIVSSVAFELFHFAAQAGPQPVPSADEQTKIQNQVRNTFKSDFAKGTIPAQLALADKLLKSAAEEKDNPNIRYVMLSEAMSLGLRAADLDRIFSAARQLDLDFDVPQLADELTDKLSEMFGGKETIEAYRAAVKREMLLASDPQEQFALAQNWMEVARQNKPEKRIASVRRAYQLLCESMRSDELKGLNRSEAEKLCKQAVMDIDKADARVGRYSLYEGIWLVKYDNNYTHQYEISLEGLLKFEKTISPDGKAFIKKDEQLGKLTRRAGVVVAGFGSAKVIERFTIEGERLKVDRYDPPSLYPKSPINKGEGVREK